MADRNEEKLSDEELARLSEALDDGFRDEYLPGQELEKLVLKDLLHTNPLGEDAVFFAVRDGAKPDKLVDATSEENLDDDGLFRATSWETDTFWGNPFGFNLDKLEAFFEEKRTEVIEAQAQRYERYLREEWYEDYDAGDSWKTFDQWLEGRIFPYTKRWFEYHILHLIAEIRRYQRQIDKAGTGAKLSIPVEYWHQKLMEAAGTLGRMVEHYRWKFSFEGAIVRRRVQSKNAGTGGGKSSSKARARRLELFMSAIEELGDLFPRVGEQAIVEQAFENAASHSSSFWKTGPGQADRYATVLRSEQPYKSRYEAIFR